MGLVPLVLTGWFLSDRSGKELRAAENRYQIQLVQEKAKQIEMFGRKYESIVTGIASAIELSHNAGIVSAPSTEARLGQMLKENPELVALYIKPATGDALSVFRSEVVSRETVEVIAADITRTDPRSRILVGSPRKLPVSNQPVISFAADAVLNGTAAARVVAISSLQSVSQSVVGVNPTKEEDLWRSGLPIVFAVDQNGEAVFHPDPAFSGTQHPMADLKIVQEWLQGGAQVQSALVPFSASFNGIDHQMIGAYSTAHVADGYSLGVITMQDESRALASVGEMRSQAWMISMLFAALALIVGFVSSRFMTAPLLSLVNVANRLGAGDLSTRVKTNSRTEIGTLGETFNGMADQIQEQIAGLAKAAEENRELFVGTVKALAAAIDGKDKYTRGHSERVSRISVAIGRRMGLPADELETLRISALLHDVGKIAVDDAILKKPAALTDEEFEIMKTHPQRGYKIMSQIPAMKEFLPGMYMHHEMVNGMGYPQGLTGDQIPLQAKIVSVADTFDAMTIDRPYQKGMELPAALERLRSFVGTRYQSDVVEALIDACKAGEVGQGIIRQLAEKRAAEMEIDAMLDRLVA
ncbi:MAG: HD domain-containing protein [Acidobacteria bacterium]|nr:HD domain-containing protein [Acidobacteriota bacterium]